MKINKKVPFFPNTPDNTHCFQAALKMVMKYFWPGEEYSWKKLEEITAKVKGLWTWPMAGIIWLQAKGVDVKIMEPFDYKKFARIGGRYLIDEYGEEVGKSQIEHSDIKQEKRFAKKYVKKVAIQKVTPTLNDLKKLLEQDYLIICNVNSRKLNRREGYSGHFVVVKGFNDKYIFLHDPGLPSFENRSVDFNLFEKAWAYPNNKARNIIALKLKKKIN